MDVKTARKQIAGTIEEDQVLAARMFPIGDEFARCTVGDAGAFIRSGKRGRTGRQMSAEDRSIAIRAARAVAADFAKGALVRDAQAEHQLLRGVLRDESDNAFAAWTDRCLCAMTRDLLHAQSAEYGRRCGAGRQADERGVDHQLVMKPDAPSRSLWIDRSAEPAGLNQKFNANATVR